MSHRVPMTTIQTNTTGSTRLDPKYFQNHSPQSSQTTNLDILPIRQQLMKQQQQNQNLVSSSTNKLTNKPSHQNSIGSNNIINNNIINNSNNNENNNDINSANPSQQHADAQYAAIISSKSTPSLASAYFPAN